MKPKSILTLSAIFLGLLSSCGTPSTANNISSKSEENYLFSKDGISLLSQDLTYNEFTGYALHVLARNETDRNIIIHSTSCTYNSYMFPAILYAEVNASSSLEEDIFFLDQTTTSFGIDKPEEFILSFTVLDANTYETLFLIDDISYRTKDYTGDFKDLSKGDILYDQNHIIIKYMERRENLLFFHVENQLDDQKIKILSSDTASLNDIDSDKINISMKQTIWKKSSAIMKLTIEEEDYQKLSFDTPLTLGFTIAISGVGKERILQRIEVTI